MEKRKGGVIAVMVWVVACVSPPPPQSQPPEPLTAYQPIEAMPGSMVELAPIDQEVLVSQPATLVVVQNCKLTLELDLAEPRLIQLPVKQLNDDSGLPQYLMSMRYGVRLGVAGDEGQCVRCIAGTPIEERPPPDLPCCRPPKLVMCP